MLSRLSTSFDGGVEACRGLGCGGGEGRTSADSSRAESTCSDEDGKEKGELESDPVPAAVVMMGGWA